MKCPYCGHADTQVKDSRVGDDGTSIRRRRCCRKCQTRFNTIEYVQSRDFIVVKKSGDRVPFERAKLTKSILLALRKRDIPQEKIDQLVSSIVRKLEMRGDHEVQSAEIGKLVMDSLFAMDKVAYVRYASVYKNFTKPDDFKAFITKLLGRK
ncbi:MAG: transcriptional regulator NrdR [Alphaproteobacteria bacterium]|nr:transcriptional regulator NrdR [Alphaproteobacteria bacterium]